MADITRSVSIIFGATDNTGSAVSGVSERINKLQGSVDEIAGPLAAVAKGVLALETALGTLAAGGMALATSKAADFSQSFAEITTLVDQPKAALSGFKDDLLAYAQSSTQSIDKINGAVYEAISSGVKYEDSLKLLTETEKLSVAGKADLTETTKTLVSTLNAYGESTDQAGRYSDILFQTVKLGQTTVPELAQSLAQVTGVAAAGKVPFETLAATIAALTATGQPTSQAITGIKAALSNIIKPSSEAEKAAAALGIKFDAAALASKGFDGVLQDVFKATKGNVGQIAELFGSVEGLNAVMVLGADKSGIYKTSLDAMRNSAGSTTEAYAKMRDEFKTVSQELLNNIEVALIKIGQEFIPGLTGIEVGLKDAFKGLSKAVDAGAFDPLFDAIDRFGKSLGEQISNIGKMLPEALAGIDYSRLIESVSGLGTSLSKAFSAIFAGIDLETPEGLAQAVQKVVDGITALTTVTSGIIDAWRPFLTILGNTIDYFTGLDSATQANVGQILGWAQQIAAAGAAVGVLTAAISLAGSGISTLGGLGKAAIPAMESLTTAVGLTSAALKNLTVAAAAFATGWEIGKLLRENVPVVKDWGDNLGTVIYRMTHWGDETERTTAASWAQAEAMQSLAGKITALAGKYAEVPDEKTIAVEAAGVQEAIDKARALGAQVDDIPAEKLTTLMVKSDEQKAEAMKKALDQIAVAREASVKVNLDQASIDKAYAERMSKIPDEQYVHVKTLADGTLLMEARGKIDKAIPETKEVKVEAKAVAESFEKITTAWLDLTKTKIEWSSKLEIAQLEEDTKRIQAAFESINTGIESTGSVISDLLGLLGKVDSSPNLSPSRIERMIEREYELRQQEFDLQERLTNAQIASMSARTQALLNGDGLIKIQTDGLTPSLEMVLTEIVKKLQLKVSQAGGDMLIGAAS